MTHNKNILLVDDEPFITSALKRLLRSRPYDIVCCNSPTEALELFQSNKFALVISDHRMPGITGAVLLSMMKSFDEQTKRILLTGQADIEAVAKAVNSGAIYKLLLKPWNDEELLLVVDNAIKHYELEESNKHLSSELENTNRKLQEVNAALEEKAANQKKKIITLANYDRVTNLPNRYLFNKRLSKVISENNNLNNKVSVLALKPSSLEIISNSYGKEYARYLFKRITRRLKNITRESHSLANIGENTFGLIYKSPADTHNALEFSQLILSIFNQSFSSDKSDLYISGYIGYTTFLNDNANANAENLIDMSEIALNEAKLDDGVLIKPYSNDMKKVAVKRVTVESSLRSALENDEFYLEYQPRYSCDTHQIVGAEALLRWKNKEGENISPAEFVPILEETGLIITVGDWVVANVCALINRIRKKVGNNFHMALNLSAKQFEDNRFQTMVFDILDRSDLADSYDMLELEITEGTLMKNVIRTKEILTKFSERGIKISLDDFGTGYSSLSYLTKFPIDYLKIDQSFIKAMEFDQHTQLIVKSIISMAHCLEMQVIAEGVETDYQLSKLKNFSCEQIQGYLFSKPISEKAFVKLLQSNNPTSLSAVS